MARMPRPETLTLVVDNFYHDVAQLYTDADGFSSKRYYSSAPYRKRNVVKTTLMSCCLHERQGYLRKSSAKIGMICKVSWRPCFTKEEHVVQSCVARVIHRAIANTETHFKVSGILGEGCSLLYGPQHGEKQRAQSIGLLEEKIPSNQTQLKVSLYCSPPCLFVA